MDWLVWITQIATIVLWAVVLMYLKRINASIEKVREEIRKIDIVLRVRQSGIARQKVNQKNPAVDSKVRVTRRDTHDLPATGHQSMAVKRKKSHGARIDNDTELHQG